MTESTNKETPVHYTIVNLTLTGKYFYLRLTLGEYTSNWIVLDSEEITSFLKFASKHGFIADKIAF